MEELKTVKYNYKKESIVDLIILFIIIVILIIIQLFIYYDIGKYDNFLEIEFVFIAIFFIIIFFIIITCIRRNKALDKKNKFLCNGNCYKGKILKSNQYDFENSDDNHLIEHTLVIEFYLDDRIVFETPYIAFNQNKLECLDVDVYVYNNEYYANNFRIGKLQYGKLKINVFLIIYLIFIELSFTTFLIYIYYVSNILNVFFVVFALLFLILPIVGIFVYQKNKSIITLNEKIKNAQLKN